MKYVGFFVMKKAHLKPALRSSRNLGLVETQLPLKSTWILFFLRRCNFWANKTLQSVRSHGANNRNFFRIQLNQLINRTEIVIFFQFLKGGNL